MKNKTHLYKLILSSFLTLFSINCLADDGGASTGGGHEIESIFREKSIQVATETLNFSDQAKKVLAFDLKNTLLQIKFKDIRFSCASGPVYQDMIRLGKNALVYKKDYKTIHIQCGQPGNIDDLNKWTQYWKTLALSRTPEDMITFIHEMVRTQGPEENEAEDSYRLSGTYQDARAIEDALNESYYDRLLNGTKRCQVTIANKYEINKKRLVFVEKVLSSNYWINISLTIDGKVIDSANTSVHGFNPRVKLQTNDPQNIDNVLLAASIRQFRTGSDSYFIQHASYESKITEQREKLMKIAKKYSCFNE